MIAAPSSKSSITGTVLLPLGFTFVLAALALAPGVRENPKAVAAFLGAAGTLAAWNAVLLWQTRRSGRTPAIEVVLRKQHYVQACAQTAVLLYWGWYWPPVYAFGPFLLGQLAFAYAFDMLLGWSRRDHYTLGFAQFPVVFSINLFLWFRPDWFYLQFLMVALGLAAKQWITWNKDGRKTHIFNPSSFPLAVSSLALLIAGRSGITAGQDIAVTQFYPPQMYLFLFLIGLPGQFYFAVTSMIMPAVLAAYAFGRIYFAVTGIYFFYDSYIPIAVFLGIHLLFTDPSTSPKTELGRIIFGVMYGLSAMGLYELLGRAGLPTFYDKLLQVPLLNLSIRGLDRLARSKFGSWLDPGRIGRALEPRMRNMAYMSIWAMAFAGLSLAHGLGDDHPGQWLPFWRQACADGRAYACPYLADMEERFCQQRSGWACNESGLMTIDLAARGEDLRRTDPQQAAGPFRQGCQLGFPAACRNLEALASRAREFERAEPELKDLPIVLRGSKGPVKARTPEALQTLGCREGWAELCGHAAEY